MAAQLLLLFVVPLWRGEFSSASKRRVAIKSLLATLVAIGCSLANWLAFTIVHGRELSFVCLTSCNLDIVASAFCLFLVSGLNSCCFPSAERLCRSSPLQIPAVHLCRTAAGCSPPQ